MGPSRQATLGEHFAIPVCRVTCPAGSRTAIGVLAGGEVLHAQVAQPWPEVVPVETELPARRHLLSVIDALKSA